MKGTGWLCLLVLATFVFYALTKTGLYFMGNGFWGDVLSFIFMVVIPAFIFWKIE